MNFIKRIALGFLLMFAVVVLGCGGGTSTAPDATEQSDTEAKTGKEYTSAYVCPMHCEGSGSAEAGQCPVCKMEYVANAELEDHDHEHGDHDHTH